MNGWLPLAVLAGLVLGQAAAMAGPQGGVFIPRNGGYEGRIGQAQVFFDQQEGGVLRVVRGDWPRLETVARAELVFAVTPAGGGSAVEVRQGLDRSPQLFFLEEGNDRIGLRVLFKLYDAGHGYHGHGMSETWLYPDGQMFVTAAATFENSPLRSGVSAARLDITGTGVTHVRALGGRDALPKAGEAVALSDAGIPGRFALLGPADAARPGLALYWRSGRMEHNTFINRGGGGAPTYHRWPDYFRQAYGVGAWARDLTVSDKGVSLGWLGEGGTGEPTYKCNTLFRLAVVADAAAARALVEAEREAVVMEVAGGVIHGSGDPPHNRGYNDQEGCYEVRKTGEPLTVTLPADPLGRTVRVKAIALSGHGGVAATLDGKAVVPQLSSDGGIADDPLAPIREEPEAPADAALVTVKLTDKPQVLRISEQPGIQLVYQTRDARRNLAIYSSKTGPRWSGLRFSLVDGHARNMRAYGNPQWALTDNLLHWFSYCGYTPEQMVDQLRDLVVVKNGPDEIVFRYVSGNAQDSARSQYTVTARADSPAMAIAVAAEFAVTEHWPYDSAQFFDVFPFRGVWPRDWWYGNVLWLTREGKWKTMDTVKATYDGDKDLARISGGGFFALYSSDRGNMVMLTRNFQPALPVEYVICGNYIDFHMDLKFLGGDGKPAAPAKGTVVRCEYDLAIWGDAKVTRDQLIDLGRKSIEAGKLALPR